MPRGIDVTRELFTAPLTPAGKAVQLQQMALILALLTEKPLAQRLGDLVAVKEYMTGVTPGSPVVPLNFDPPFLDGTGTTVINDLVAAKAAIVTVADFLNGEYYNDPASHRERMNVLLAKLLA